MGTRLRIVLLIETSRGFGRMLLDGVADYARTYGPWTFYQGERSLDDPVPPRLRQWKPDGVIARLLDARQVARIRRLRVPIVDVLGERTHKGIPRVVPDQQSVVRAALDHLLERGYRHLAYAGFEGVWFSNERRDLFVKYAAQAGCRSEVFQDQGLRHAVGLARVEEETFRHDKRLAAWLRALPKPAGMMACNDTRAYQVLSVCGECGIDVPGEIAVVGVNDDPVLCKLSNPPLSSVDPNAHRVGYEAAALVARMIDGERRPAADPLRGCPASGSTVVRVEAASVVARGSTDALALAGTDLSAAMRHIRQHACDGLTSDDLAVKLAVSRRTLYRLFDRRLGHSPREEITRVKLERVKDLLTTTRLPAEEIARLTGFEFTETMHRLFRKRFGQPPGAYRVNRRISV